MREIFLEQNGKIMGNGWRDICFWNNVGIEVIGNVFDNPDLLKESEDKE